MSSALLQALAWLAITHDPAVVRERLLCFFAEVVSDYCCAEQFRTATLFFGWLIADFRVRSAVHLQDHDAKAMMKQWLPVTDPLGIAEDPECGYGQATGFGIEVCADGAPRRVSQPAAGRSRVSVTPGHATRGAGGRDASSARFQTYLGSRKRTTEARGLARFRRKRDA